MESQDNSTPLESTHIVAVHPLGSEAEYEACIQLQQEIWGDDVREVVPAAILQITQKVGGVAAGAFEPDGSLAGFVFGITGVVAGEVAHWSHLLAVKPSRRDRGIGLLLKQYQRDFLRGTGVHKVYWTFDPLESRNAHLNLTRIGVRIIEYVPHMYGEANSAKTDAVIGSDRFVVCWEITSPRAPQPVTGLADAVTVAAVTAADSEIIRLRADPDRRKVLIEIPTDIQQLKLESPASAVACRQRTRSAFQYYLAESYRVCGFARDYGRGTGAYVLEPRPHHEKPNI